MVLKQKNNKMSYFSGILHSQPARSGQVGTQVQPYSVQLGLSFPVLIFYLPVSTYIKGRIHGRGVSSQEPICLAYVLLILIVKKTNFFKCTWSHNNNTALIKQISLLDTALVMTNT
mgnify:CR=1 FL=1